MPLPAVWHSAGRSTTGASADGAPHSRGTELGRHRAAASEHNDDARPNEGDADGGVTGLEGVRVEEGARVSKGGGRPRPGERSAPVMCRLSFDHPHSRRDGLVLAALVKARVSGMQAPCSRRR